jgi:3-hydroxyacyl-[acyl-carrier-protein] dehydratase
MRWMWIDRVLEHEPGERLVAVKAVSLAEEHLHDHFEAGDGGESPLPVMPGSLIIEGMAQTAGILVGYTGAFKEKVILAKIGKASLEGDALPGDTLRYTATMTRYDNAGAATQGVIERIDPANPDEAAPFGEIDLVFSHVDRNMAGTIFPGHNCVFSDAFRTLLRTSGLDADF